jgi:hypothetical protein
MKQVQTNVIEVKKEVGTMFTGVENKLKAIEKQQDAGLFVYSMKNTDKKKQCIFMIMSLYKLAIVNVR